MATKGSKAKAEPKGEWKAKTLKEWKASEAVTWRAQKSTSPEGDVFVGVRQYIKTKTKGEIAGRSGITFKMDGTVLDNTKNVLGLFEAVVQELMKNIPAITKGKADEAVRKARKLSPKAQAIKDEEDAEAALRAKSDFVFCKEGNVYLKSCREVDGVMKVKTTDDADDAQTFKLKQANALAEKLSSKWSMQEL